jgi:proteic killer suppression protein
MEGPIQRAFKSRPGGQASGNWRITFGWTEGDAIDVDLEDYH